MKSAQQNEEHIRAIARQVWQEIQRAAQTHNRDPHIAYIGRALGFDWVLEARHPPLEKRHPLEHRARPDA